MMLIHRKGLSLYITLTNIKVILFGPNDSCFGLRPKGPNAFVPLDEFKENLVKIVTHAALRAHSARLILIALPPVEERRMEKRSAELGYPSLNRTNECTKTYADATREVADSHDIVCLDLFSIFMALAGWKPGEPLPGALDQPENEVLKSFLYDGTRSPSYL
jgi:isoamyl acetate esterase